MFGVECACRNGDKTPGAILRGVFKNETAQPPCKDCRLGWAVALRTLNAPQVTPCRRTHPPPAAEPWAALRGWSPRSRSQPRCTHLPKTPPEPPAKPPEMEHPPFPGGAAELCLRPTDPRHSPSSNGQDPAPRRPPAPDSPAAARQAAPSEVLPGGHRGAPLASATSSSTCREIVWLLFSFFLLSFAI